MNLVADPPPTGTVTFSATGLVITGFCVLQPIGPAASACEGSYAPAFPSYGYHTLSATYNGDLSHAPSTASTEVLVIGPNGEGLPPPPAPPRPAPRTLFRKKPPATTTSHLVGFAFGSDEPGGGFECALDARSLAPCTSPFVRNLKVGPHRFRVRAVNPEGLADPTPRAYHWRIVGPG